MLDRHGAWPGFYRRSATGLAARRFGIAPCCLYSKDRRRATGPPARNKTQRGFETTLGFCVAKISTLHQSIPSDTICVWITPITEEKINPVFLCCEASPAASKHPKRRYLSLPSATCGEQSGDRQRREKGPPILTAEKGEHERAPNVSDSYPTPLRATLRAPPSKWAIKAFFRRVSAASRGRGQPLRAVCPRNVVRLFRPNGRNWTPRIYSGRPTVRLPQAEAHGAQRRGPSS